MTPGNSQPAACSIPSPHAPDQNVVIIESETESESEIETYPDREFDYIENQLGLPEYRYQHGSSPPPVKADIENEIKLNSESEFFSTT